MQFLVILKLVISILPLVIDAIKLVEKSIPGTGHGEAKLSATRTILESSYGFSTDAIVSFESIWPTLKKTISGLVSAFNATGVFVGGK
jgi:hypothetical protein